MNIFVKLTDREYFICIFKVLDKSDESYNYKRQNQNMKNLFILLVLTFSSFSITGQIEPISLEFDSIRALTELNTSQAGEGYPWISKDGLRIYFTRGINGNDNRIMYSKRSSINDFFSDPIQLSINVDSVGSICQWLSDDELHIYFFRREVNGSQSTTLYHATRDSKSEEFDQAIKVELLGFIDGFLLGPSLTNDLNTLIIYNSSQNIGDSGINILEKTGENEYIFKEKIQIPHGYVAGPGQLSPDGLRFFLSLLSESNGRQDIYIAERESVEDEFDTFYFIDNEQINNVEFSDIQPTITKNDHFMAFTRNIEPLWQGNDLYIAYNFGPVSTIDYNSQEKNNVKVSPNPASEFINFDLENVDCISPNMSISVYSANGRLIGNKLLSKAKANASLSTVHYNSGLYFYKVKCESELLASGSFIVEN